MLTQVFLQLFNQKKDTFIRHLIRGAQRREKMAAAEKIDRLKVFGAGSHSKRVFLT